MHLLHVAGGWHLWVDTGPLSKRADISPYVGVRCDILERTVSGFLSLPQDDTVGSLGANIRYIVEGKHRHWGEGATSTEVLRSIDAAFVRLRPLMNLDTLAEGWNVEAARDPLWRYREITLLLLRRDTAQIRSKLKEARDDFCRYDDSMAAQFRDFEHRVLSQLQIV